jgi:hypothetical protein
MACHDRAAMTAVPPFSEATRPQRAALWMALSEFWLDTELATHDLDAIARTIAATPWSLAEVRAIHDEEVAPVVAANLASVAGVWAGFDRDWLCARCEARARQGGTWVRRLATRLRRPRFDRLTADYWRAVEARLAGSGRSGA